MLSIVLQAGAIYALQKGMEYLSNHAPAEKLYSGAELTTVEKVHTVFSYFKGSTIALLGKKRWQELNALLIENWALAHLLSLSLLPSYTISQYLARTAWLCLVIANVQLIGGICFDAAGYRDLAEKILPLLTKRSRESESFCLEEMEPEEIGHSRLIELPNNLPRLSDDNPLSEFICPLTRKPIRYLVMDNYNNSYEKEAILKHLEKEWVSPIDGKFLSPSDLVDMLQSEYKLEDLRNYIERVHEKLGRPVNFNFINLPGIPLTLHGDRLFRLFICPLTRMPIRYPVGDPTSRGSNGCPRLYERRALSAFVSVNRYSPGSRNPLNSAMFIQQPRILALIENRLTFYQEHFNRFLQGVSSLNQLVVPPPPQALLAAAKAENSRYF